MRPQGWRAVVCGLLGLLLLRLVRTETAPAGLKIVNALPPSILEFSEMFLDVFVNDTLVLSRVEYLMGSTNGSHSYLPLDAPATYNVSFAYSERKDPGQLVASTILHVDPGTLHTIFIFGRNTPSFPIKTVHLLDRTTAKTTYENNTSGERGRSKATASLRYFNAGLSYSATTVKANGKNLFVSTPYGEAWNKGNYVEIDASTAKDGVFDFIVVDASYEEIEITFDRLRLVNGCTFTLFSVGVLGNYYSPLMIVDTKDLC